MAGSQIRITPSMVVALIALVFAMTGGAVAATSIGGAHAQAAKTKTGPRGKQGKRGKRGKTGAAGATGKTGAQGIQGIPGPVGAVGPAGATGAPGAAGTIGPAGPAGTLGTVRAVQGPTIHLTADDHAVDSSTATCPAGTIAISGGADYPLDDDINAPVAVSYWENDRFPDSASWTVGVVDNNDEELPGDQVDMFAVAYCAVGTAAGDIFPLARAELSSIVLQTRTAAIQAKVSAERG